MKEAIESLREKGTHTHTHTHTHLLHNSIQVGVEDTVLSFRLI